MLADYFNWMSRKYTINSFESGDEIITPFQNSIGDDIAIYLIRKGHGQIMLTDDGTTLNDLNLLGINFKLNSRIQIIDDVAQTYGVKRFNDQLSITGKTSEFPVMKHSLLQAMLHIDDLSYTKKETAKNVFFEEVLNFLINKNFGGLPEYKIDGSSGINYKIAYAIGPSSSKPERFIQIINNANFQNIALETIAIDDIRKTGMYPEDKLSYSVIYNDSVNSTNDKSNKLAHEYGVNLIGWQNKEELLKLRN